MLLQAYSLAPVEAFADSQFPTTGSSTFNYRPRDSHISTLFFTEVLGGQATSYLLAASFPCPIYRLLSGSHIRFKLLWPHCRWIWPCRTFSLVIWAGHSPRHTAKLGNTWHALSPMSPLLQPKLGPVGLQKVPLLKGEIQHSCWWLFEPCLYCQGVL